MWTSKNSRQIFVSWHDQVQAAPYSLAVGVACILAVYLADRIYWPLLAMGALTGTALAVSSWKQRAEKTGEAIAWIAVSGPLAYVMVVHVDPLSGLSSRSMLMHAAGSTLFFFSTQLLLMNAYLKSRHSRAEASTSRY